MPLIVPRIAQDFSLTGRGSSAAWKRAQWQDLQRIGGRCDYATRCKLVYSAKGIYGLFDCEDQRLTCGKRRDFDDIYRDDVVEAFFWTDTRYPVYFEYELSPLNVELPILVSNNGGTFMGWRPWHFEQDRRTRRATSVRGGPKRARAKVTGWTAEFFIPFALLKGMSNTPPRKGTTWRANMYRIDYDDPTASQWAWRPETGPHFHHYKKFGTIEFG